MDTITITSPIKKLIVNAIRIAISYENATGRKLGITGEIAEVLISHKLKLMLLKNSISPGYDAIDKKGRTYQIKAARKIGDLHRGRIGTISPHKYDFLVMVLMNFSYEIKEAYKLPCVIAENLAKRYEKRNPLIRSIAIKKWRIK